MDKTPQGTAKFKFTDLPSLISEAFKAWIADYPFRLSATMAYYAVLALPGLLVIIMSTVGAVWDPEVVQSKLTSEISAALGRDAATAIGTMMKETQDMDKNLIWTIIGIGSLIFGATGVFYHLQVSLNQIWKIKPDPNIKIWKRVRDRVRSFAFILVIGFLLLISFVITTALNAVSDYIRKMLPDILLYVAYAIDFLFSIGMITVLFALLFKYLPDARIRWKTVWTGAIITAVLFVIGKSLLGFYFGEAEPDSTYGAAGTMVLILLWVSYSCLILFFGAEFTYVYAKRYGIGIKPDDTTLN